MENRPRTTVILAMTADGKIADFKGHPARFSSAADRAHLARQISLADAVLFGASTLRAYGTTLPISDPQLLQAREQRKQPPQPFHIVCSGSGNIEPDWRFFFQAIPRWLLTTTAGLKLLPTGSQKGFERILIAETETSQSLDWFSALAQLSLLGIDKLAILGGGELVASLLASELIDEFWLTVCPVIFGGRIAPTPVGGTGFLATAAKQLQLLEVEAVGEEIFLHYRLRY